MRSSITRWTLLVIAAVVGASVLPVMNATAAVVGVTSVTPWDDTSGNSLQAHGGGMIKVGSTYFWVGEDHANVTAGLSWGPGVYTPPFRNIACYSSTDLRTWHFENNVLSLQSSGDLGPNRVVERPKIIFNAASNTYVLWVHIDNPTYSEARVGVATSSTPCGRYLYKGSFRPLGQQSRDMTVFQDTDGSAYLIHSSGGNTARRILRLTSNYQGVSTQVAVLGEGEAPAVFKSGNTYYLLSSHATGWESNDNFYATASSIAGPWTEQGDFTPGSNDTYNSQTTFVLPVTGSSGTSFMYMGDRWDASSRTSFGNSRYIWQRLVVDGTSVSMAYSDNWTVNTATGTSTPGARTCAAPIAGTSYAIFNRNSGRALNVRGSTTADGAAIEQWTFSGWRSQKWYFTATGSGYYTVANIGSGKLMDIYQASTANGASNVQWSANAGANQQWALVDAGNGYCKIRNRNSGELLDMSGASVADGGPSIQWNDNQGLNQQWLISPA